MDNAEQKRYDAIIVGGGLAGLTSAVFLSQSGKKILLIEKNAEFGGLVNSFEMDGFVFDAGARAILGVVLAMLKDLNLDIDVVSSKVSLGVEDKIIGIEDSNSVGEYRELLVSLYPDSVEDIDKFIEVMIKIMKLIDIIYGIDNPLFKDIKRDKEYFFKELLPWLPKFMFAMNRIERLSKPCDEYLKELIKDPSLIDIISQHFFKGTPTFFALSYFTLYSSYVYPKGGTGKLAEALAEKIQEFKGEIITNTVVKKIYADQQFVVDENNNEYYYKDLVWAADLKTFYNITSLGNLAPKIRGKFEKTKELIAKGRPSESVFSLYLEVDLPVSYFKKSFNGHLFYTPSRKGLGNINKSELKGMLEKWGEIDKEEVLSWLDRFLKYNTYEIAIPAIRDSNLAPEGKTGLIVSLLMEAELFYKVKESGWYEEFREEIENKVISVLSESLCPELKDKVEKQFSFTPLSFEKRVGSTGGAIVGWSFEAPIPVVYKMQQVNKSINTPIPNIYQVGQWAYNPAGTPTCIITGKLAADRITKKNK
ncbi:phytoene desaturase family protein [Trichococcus alkaliphilus]|uniref:phytoene desaturase family protein n=1 Tax=Trichococcus alkaliphilus TaxID=2052943 RepID=UPI000D0BCE5E|nr:NAD(P)/FAD-dependent oxidoreductase [Trichococcus alkaliphilus]